MITISQVVTDIIDQKPFLAENLDEGIINYSSLARMMVSEIEERLHKKIQEGAVLMALKRYKPKGNLVGISRITKVLNKTGDIIVRSDLVDYTIKNSETLLKKHIGLLNSLTEKKEVFYTFVQGVFESNLVVSSIISATIDKKFADEKIIEIQRNLSAITIRLAKENVKIPGLYYYILKQIAWEGINLIEVISTTNEFTLVVNDSDIDNAFKVLKNLKKNK